MVVAPNFQSRMWSPVAGAVFNWRHPKTSATASFSHEVSNGGGLASAVTLDAASVDVLRQLARPLTVDFGFAMSQSVPIVTLQTVRTYSGRIQFAYHFRNHFAITTGYARDDNDYSGGTASANRAWVSFSYDFLKPLGRGR